MGILKPLAKDIGHFKGGISGDTGSGKTTTAALIAIGLYRYLQLKGPVAFYDSERGSGFVADLFKAVKIDVVGIRSRAFSDLIKFMQDVEKEMIGVTLIDSITHPWRELMASYKAKKRRDKLILSDWGPIKDAWHNGYSMRYVNAKTNIIMCGRQQNVFEDVQDDDFDESEKKRWKPVKVGVRMATEGETGYEPNLLMHMERKLIKSGAAYARVATVIKDRSFRLDGAEQVFEMPMLKNGKPDLMGLIEQNAPFEFIRPHVESLDPEAGIASGGIENHDSTELFDNDGNSQRMREEQEKTFLLGNIEHILHKYFPSRDKISMKSKNDILEGVSWALDRRTRNWDIISQKFSLMQVRMMYSLMDTLVSPIKRPQLDEALALGVSDKGEITNADASPEAIMRLCEKLIKESGTGPKDDLPF